MTDLDLSSFFADQLEWHWSNQLRARLAGLTDEEYFWEPVADCWSVRPRGTETAPIEAGSGENPLPLSQFPDIWSDNLGILLGGMAAVL